MGFGYPSALVGHFLVASSDKSATTEALAGYSDDIHDACAESCQAGFQTQFDSIMSTAAAPNIVALMPLMSCDGKTAKDLSKNRSPLWTGSMQCGPAADGFVAANVYWAAMNSTNVFK